MNVKGDIEFMREAIALAKKSARIGEAPFGAVIVMDGKIIARGADRVVRKKDPTAHAEIIAIRQAASRLKTHDLSGCEIYTSSEPCQMCMAAIKYANIDRLYYASVAKDLEDAGVLSCHAHSELVSRKWEVEVDSENILRGEAMEAFEIYNKSNKE